MTFRFPIEVAKDLVAVTGQFSKQSMEVQGIGLVCIPQTRCTLLPQANSLSDRENLRRHMYSHRCDVLRAHEVAQIRAWTPSVPEPASSPDLHTAWRRVPLPATRHGQDPRHSTSDRLGAAATIRDEASRQQGGTFEAGVGLQLSEFKSLFDGTFYALPSSAMIDFRSLRSHTANVAVRMAQQPLFPKADGAAKL